MSTFNLTRIIEANKLDRVALANELFPGNKFPEVALKRVLNGLSFLDTNQLNILASVLGLQVSDLFLNEMWSTRMQNDKIVFYKNDYRVELNTETLITNIFYKDKLVASETLVMEKNIKLSDYLKSINETIINLI
jgi:hypothetical protein